MEVINFFPLRDAEISLKAVQITGARGIPQVLEGAIMQWVDYIRATQLYRCLKALPGIRPVASIGHGVIDLVRLPVEHYQKDHRLIRGLKHGAQSFVRHVAVEGLDLTSVCDFMLLSIHVLGRLCWSSFAI